MENLKAIRGSVSEGARRLLPTLAVTYLFIFLLCFNSYANDAQSLIDAVQQDDISTIKTLLAKGVDVNAKDNYGATALMYAFQDGHSEIVKTLLDNGADVNAKDNNGKTALMAASLKGHSEIVKTLLGKGADVNGKIIMVRLPRCMRLRKVILG